MSVDVFHGGPSGARTQDTLLKSSVSTTCQERAKEVKMHTDVLRRRWLVGVVAVRAAVKNRNL